MPLVQIIGDQDPPFRGARRKWLIDTVPTARQMIIPDSGHFPMVENTGPFTSALVSAISADVEL